MCLEVNTQPGMTETSLVPDMAAHAGMSFRRAGRMDGGGRVVRSLSASLRMRAGRVPGRPSPPTRPPPKVLLRGERARARTRSAGACRSIARRRSARDRADAGACSSARPATGAVRGGQFDGFVARHGGVGDVAARALGFGVDVVTVSGATHMSEPRILAIAGVSAKESLPFFDVAAARARLEADPLVKQASVRKLYPNQIVIDIVERTPYARLAEGRRGQGDRRRRRADRRGQRQPLRRPAVRRRRGRERPRARIRRPARRDGGAEAPGRGRRPGRRAALEPAAQVGHRRQAARDRSRRPRSPSSSRSSASQRILEKDVLALDFRAPGRVFVRLTAGVGRRLGRSAHAEEKGRPAMTFRPLPPRMRQIPARKSAILSVLDVGASKIVCLIARLTPMEPSTSLRGRTHRCKILGIGHQRSNGVKGGAIVDLQAAEHADAARHRRGRADGRRRGRRRHRQHVRRAALPRNGSTPRSRCAARPSPSTTSTACSRPPSAATAQPGPHRPARRCRPPSGSTRRGTCAIPRAWSATNSASTCTSPPASWRRRAT